MRNSCFDRLVKMNLLLPNWREYIRDEEAKQVVLQTAIDRDMRKGSGLANDQAPASLTTWLRPHKINENILYWPGHALGNTIAVERQDPPGAGSDSL